MRRSCLRKIRQHHSSKTGTTRLNSTSEVTTPKELWIILEWFCSKLSKRSSLDITTYERRNTAKITRRYMNPCFIYLDRWPISLSKYFRRGVPTSIIIRYGQTNRDMLMYISIVIKSSRSSNNARQQKNIPTGEHIIASRRM